MARPGDVSLFPKQEQMRRAFFAVPGLLFNLNCQTAQFSVAVDFDRHDAVFFPKCNLIQLIFNFPSVTTTAQDTLEEYSRSISVSFFLSTWKLN